MVDRAWSDAAIAKALSHQLTTADKMLQLGRGRGPSDTGAAAQPTSTLADGAGLHSAEEAKRER